MMRYILILALLVCSCSPKFQVGKYASTKNNNYFEFKNDSTFVYEYKLFHLYKRAEGKWRITNGTTLVLNSSFKDSIVNLKVKETTSEDLNNHINVHLQIKNGFSLLNYYCQPYVNGRPFFIDNVYDGKRSDSISNIIVKDKVDGVCFVIHREPIVTHTTAFADAITTELYKPSTAYSNLNVEIEINDSLFYRRVFNNEKLRVKNKKIELYNKDRKKWESIKKVSDSLKIISNPVI